MFKLIIGAVVLALIVLVLVCGYVKAPPDTAYIISGLRKKPRILVGKAGFKIPFFERLDKLSLGAIQIDVKTGSAVPTSEFINVRIDSTVAVRVGRSPEMIALAAENFLNTSRDTISRKINDLLEGNIREIAGSMRLTEMVSDRKVFGEKVQENAVPDLARYGLELITFNVQNFTDDGNVIENLGIDNVEQIRKNAMIAKSNAQREVAMAEAENARLANDAKVAAQEEIASRQNDLAVKKAELKREADTKAAEADAAAGIEQENQRKTKEVAATNANIARAEREAELKKKQVELKEYELDALVRKQADADKYATEQKAEADLVRRQKEAEAKAYATKAEADANRYAAEQQAEGIRAVGLAEAEAIEKKAEAQKKFGEASVIEMYLKALPNIVSCASAPLANVDSIAMYGDGNSSKLVGDVMMTVNKVTEAMKANGIDIQALINKALTPEE
mgnify:CR=1 FL=1